MNSPAQLCIFGEVLFDCFPTGEQVLGGAPFNVAWHLQALGDRPQFLSRVGDDALGKKILAAMHTWGMNTTGIQLDPEHPTGRVAVKVVGNEPSYNILPDCAYDFIDAANISPPTQGGILYHGSLALRNATSRHAFTQLAKNPAFAIFLDVNLRSPWWHKKDVFHWLEQAQWVKLNQDELKQLGFAADDIRQAMAEFQSRFHLEQLILTRGEEGALVRTALGEYHQVTTEKVPQIVDTVGAGDAFSAVYIHGLLSAWPITGTLAMAQKFACKIIGLRGATTAGPAFYNDFIRSFG